MLSDNLALLLFAVAGWLLTVYFGFFRFKQYVWSRHKVSYDLFTRQNQRRQLLGNRLCRLCAVAKEGRGIDLKRRLAATAYLEQLRESSLLARQGIVTQAQINHWLDTILNQLASLDATTLRVLRQSNAALPYDFVPLDRFLTEAASAAPDRAALLHAFLDVHHPPAS